MIWANQVLIIEIVHVLLILVTIYKLSRLNLPPSLIIYSFCVKIYEIFTKLQKIYRFKKNWKIPCLIKFKKGKSRILSKEKSCDH